MGCDNNGNDATIYLVRKWETSNSTTGTFTTSDGAVAGYILEPAGPSTSQANQDKRIPPGTYEVSAYSSKKFPKTLIVSNETVSANRLILIHWGNTGSDTEGCLLPGSSRGNGRVNNSRAMVKELRNWFDNRYGRVNLIIIDVPFPGGCNYWNP